MIAAPSNTRRPGYALIVVLLVIAVLSLAAYRFADAMTAEYTVAVRATEAAQAKAFAASGIHYAAGVLADPDSVANQLGGDPTAGGEAFANQTIGPADGPRGGGRFTVFSVGDTFSGSGEGRYQVRNAASDEGGKINVNALIQLDPTGQVLYDALMKLPNMTEDVADAIVDWVDPDDSQRPSGAESAYYTGTGNPYRAKNGPANTLDELLFVRGITPTLLYGNDRNRNGRLDSGESDGNDFNRGWSEFITVYGRELDVDSAGSPRINLNDPNLDAQTLSDTLTAAVGQEMSDYILFYRLGGTVGEIGASGSSGSGSGSTGGSTGAAGGGASGATAAAAPAATSSAPAAPSSSGSSRSGGSSPSSGSGGAGSRGSTPSGGTASNSTVSTSRSGSTTVTTTTTQTTTITATPSTGSGSSSGGSGGSGAAAATTPGTADDLRAAVQQMISSGTTPSKNLDSLFAIYNTQATLPIPEGSPENTPAKTVPSPMNDEAKLKEILPQLLDATTPRTGLEVVPRINVNTAPPEVLAALPELTEEDVSAITAARGSVAAGDPAYTTGAWLVTAANVSPTAFQALEKYVTGRSMVYRVQSVGYFGRGGPAARVEAVIDTNQGYPRIVYFRDLTDLGRGFDLPR